MFGRILGLFKNFNKVKDILGLFGYDKLVIIAVVGGFVASLVAGVTYYVKSNKDTIKQQSEVIAQIRVENAQREISEKLLSEQLKLYKQRMLELQKDTKNIQKELSGLMKFNSSMDKKYNDLDAKLHRDRQGKKPIEELAEVKPTLVEKTINDSIERQKKCIAILTGSLDYETEKIDCSRYFD